MRMIDADALKKDWSMANKCEECPQDARKCQYEQNFTRMDICDMLDEAPTVGGWISVKDRLPEKDKDVIIYGYYVGRSGEIYPITIISDIEEFKWRECVPIAWMQIPELPKDGDA